MAEPGLVGSRPGSVFGTPPPRVGGSTGSSVTATAAAISSDISASLTSSSSSSSGICCEIGSNSCSTNSCSTNSSSGIASSSTATGEIGMNKRDEKGISSSSSSSGAGGSRYSNTTSSGVDDVSVDRSAVSPAPLLFSRLPYAAVPSGVPTE